MRPKVALAGAGAGAEGTEGAETIVGKVAGIGWAPAMEDISN
jgi:hypothetical protein